MIGTNELDYGRTDEGSAEESKNLAEFIISRYRARFWLFDFGAIGPRTSIGPCSNSELAQLNARALLGA